LSAKRGNLYEGIETESFDGRRLHELLSEKPVSSRGRFNGLATLAPIRRASSRVRRCAAERRPRSSSQRLTVGVADNETPPIQLGVGLLDGPRRGASPRRFRAVGSYAGSIESNTRLSIGQFPTERVYFIAEIAEGG
jgi:hypothetical protein